MSRHFLFQLYRACKKFLIGVCLVFPLAGQAQGKKVDPINDFRVRLKELEASVYREDPNLGYEINEVKSEIEKMLLKLGDLCRTSGATISCQSLQDVSILIELGMSPLHRESVAQDAISIYILPTDLSLGGLSRMAVNSRQFRTILIDLKAWRDLRDQSQKYLFLFMELARFMDFESEERRYLAAAEVMEVMKKGKEIDEQRRIEIATPRLRGEEADGMALDMKTNQGYQSAVLRQDGKLFFSFSGELAESTDLYVLNQQATPLRPACFQKDSPGIFNRNPFVSHRFLDTSQTVLQVCMKQMLQTNLPRRSHHLYIIPKIGLVVTCM